MVPTPPVSQPCLIRFPNRLWKEPHQPPYLGKQASTALNRDATRLSRRALEETRQTQLSTNTELTALKSRHFMCFSAGPRDRSWFILAGLSYFSDAILFYCSEITSKHLWITKLSKLRCIFEGHMNSGQKSLWNKKTHPAISKLCLSEAKKRRNSQIITQSHVNHLNKL